MIKYGYEVIQCVKLDVQFIKELNIDNYRNKKLVIQVLNTSYIDKNALLELKKYNIDVKISVIGPYDIKNVVNEQQKEQYFYNTLYDLDELYEIITQFEEIEKGINSHWNKFDIVVYLVEIITRNIVYDPEYFLMYRRGEKITQKNGPQDEADYYDSTLRGIIRRKSVCAGYAVIFKELANRNGIECKIVNGKAFAPNGVPHTWNLIRIDNKIYPIDISFKNKKYRTGDFENNDDISCNIDEFKKMHYPNDKTNNIGLTQIPREIVEKSKRKTMIRKHYNMTTYVLCRKDKTRFVLSQIGMYRGMYQYLYSEINSDGSYEIPTMVFSESNLVKEITGHKFEESDYYDDFIKSFINVLFSKENLADSKLNKRTKYIGCCELPKKNGFVKSSIEIIKSERAVSSFNLDNIKSQRRDDGSTVTLVQLPNKSGNGLLYEYHIFILSSGPKVTEYSVYSNSNYFSMTPNIVVNSILNDSSLIESISQSGIIR